MTAWAASLRQTVASRATGIAVALLVLGAFGLRVFLTWPSVFVESYVAFLETDAWYHMRLVDALVTQFPWRLWHDPYLVHPGGEPVNAGPVFDWIVAGLALVLGGGSPSPRLVDIVGAFVPPVLGALTVVPVFVLGRELWSRRAGLWAAFMAVVMPGQMLERALLGFTDHHCAETLLSTTAMMCAVIALRRQGHRARRWAIAGGVALGAYLLTWGGGVLFVVILVAAGVTHIVVDAVRGDDSADVTRVVGPVLIVAAAMVAPWARTRPYFAYQFAALVGGTAATWALHGGQRMAVGLAWGRARWLGLIGATAIGAAILAYAVLGDHAASLLSDASRVSPFRRSGFVSEAQPLLVSKLRYPIPLWREFTSSLLLAMAGLGLWAGGMRSGARSPAHLVFAFWTIVITAATFGQVRFAYYLGVNVALLGGLACDVLLVRAARAASAPLRAMAVGVMAAAIALPGVPQLRALRLPAAALHPDWHDALSWMRSNTPEPFASPDAYLRPDAIAASHSAYGVLAWWDYGYWITRVARRVPVSNPRQTGLDRAGDVLLASSGEAARRAMDRAGAGYVVVNWQLQSSSADRQGGFFSGMVVASGGDPDDYCGFFAKREQETGRLGPRETYCYPEYYRTVAMRLYLYEGRAAAPPGPVSVVAFQHGAGDARGVKVLTAEWTFPTYEEAREFVGASGRDDIRIVSRERHVTCVPLEALDDYRVVYRSLGRENGRSSPHLVQVYEYRPDRAGAP